MLDFDRYISGSLSLLSRRIELFVDTGDSLNRSDSNFFFDGSTIRYNDDIFDKINSALPAVLLLSVIKARALLLQGSSQDLRYQHLTYFQVDQPSHSISKINTLPLLFELHASLREYYSEKHLAFTLRTLMKLVEKSQESSGRMQRKEGFEI